MALIVCFPSDLTADGYILNFGFNIVHIVSCVQCRFEKCVDKQRNCQREEYVVNNL